MTAKNEPLVSPDDIASHSAAVTAAEWWIDHTDETGRAHLRLSGCPYVGPSSAPDTVCGIGGDDAGDYALVGGGGEIEEGGAGALLTATWPSGQAWYARSKDHIYSFPHRLRGYTLALKLDGISGAALRSMISFDTVMSDPVTAHPSVTTGSIGNTRILLGGGAYAMGSGAGQLLVSSQAIHTPIVSATLYDAWKAESKDHGISDPGRVWAVVISMPRCPWGSGQPCFGQDTYEGYDVGPAGTYATKFSAPYRGLVTGISAQSTGDQPNGRLLADLYPASAWANDKWNSGLFAANKDHAYAQSGNLYTRTIGIIFW
jgi:hypothetical protein